MRLGRSVDDSFDVGGAFPEFPEIDEGIAGFILFEFDSLIAVGEVEFAAVAEVGISDVDEGASVIGEGIEEGGRLIC